MRYYIILILAVMAIVGCDTNNPMIDDINARLDEIDDHLDNMNTRLDEIDGHLGNMNARLDETDSRLDNTATFNSGVSSRIDQINTRMDNMNARLDQMDSHLDNTATFNSGVSSRIDQISTRMDNMNARLDQMDSHLDSAATFNSGVSSRIDQINTRMDNINARLDEINFLEDNYIDASNWVGRWNIISINDVSWIDLDPEIEGIKLTGFLARFYSDGACSLSVPVQTERYWGSVSIFEGSYWVKPSEYMINVIDFRSSQLDDDNKVRDHFFELIKPHLSGPWSISKGIGDLYLLKLGGITLEKEVEK